MAAVTLRICGMYGVELGTLQWDQEAGTVSGYMADTIAIYGGGCWWCSDLSFGDSETPALHSNDGFIALLANLNLSTPDLTLINVATDDAAPGWIN